MGSIDFRGKKNYVDAFDRKLWHVGLVIIFLPLCHQLLRILLLIELINCLLCEVLLCNGIAKVPSCILRIKSVRILSRYED